MGDVITVESQEEVERVQARLARATSRQVYIYLPRVNPALRRRLSLTLLRRTAEDLGLELTIVSRDSATRVMAGKVGLRASRNLEVHPDRETAGRAGSVLSSASARMSPLLAGSSLVLAIVLLVLGLVLAVVVLPQATVKVTPVTAHLEMTVELVADPDLSTPDVPARRIPARRLEAVLERRATEPTSERREVPDEPARGTIVFVNQSERDIAIPTGSVVSTSDGDKVKFRTLEPVTVPGPAGTRAQAQVEAVKPGREGNVPAFAIDLLDPSLGLPVAVVNERPMTGGTVRSVSIVTREQLDRVRNELLAEMRREAVGVLGRQIGEGEKLVASTVEVQVVEESFSHQAGTVADQFTVVLQVQAAATAVDIGRARQLGETVLQQQVPPEQIVVDGSLASEIDGLGVEDDGRAIVRVRTTAVVQARVSERDIKDAVRGRPVDEAVALLRERFPLAAAPVIDMSRGWMSRVPWLPMRIEVVILRDGTIVGERWLSESWLLM